MGSLEFSLWIVGKLLCSCLCLFDAIIELHTMDERNDFNDFLIGKWKWILYVMMAYLIHDLSFVSGGIYHIQLKA